MPCSIERTPARTAFLMPAVDWACAMTQRPAAAASDTSMASSSGANCGWRGSSRAESTPPEVATLMTSAPSRISSRTFRRISSGPSTTPLGMPGYVGPMSASAPLGSQRIPVPPGLAEHGHGDLQPGPGISPSSTARFMPRSAPPASRTVVMPWRRVTSMFAAAW